MCLVCLLQKLKWGHLYEAPGMAHCVHSINDKVLLPLLLFQMMSSHSQIFMHTKSALVLVKNEKNNSNSLCA